MAIIPKQTLWGLAFTLLIGADRIVAETANYQEINTYRFCDARQTSPNAPTIRRFFVMCSIRLRLGDSAKSLKLIAPSARKYGFKRSTNMDEDGWWEGLFGVSSGQAKHLSLMPSGRYQIQCSGGKLSGQGVSFDLPEAVLNPFIPFLEKNSYLLLSKGKLDVNQVNTLFARRISKTGAPFAPQSEPEESSKNLVVQIIDYSASGVAVFVWNDTSQYDDAGNASFTIPGGKLLKNKVYTLSLETQNYYPDGNATTPEGPILKRLHGITLCEIPFRTAKN